jgi:hypothetical protein
MYDRSNMNTRSKDAELADRIRVAERIIDPPRDHRPGGVTLDLRPYLAGLHLAFEHDGQSWTKTAGRLRLPGGRGVRPWRRRIASARAAFQATLTASERAQATTPATHDKSRWRPCDRAGEAPTSYTGARASDWRP